MRRTFNVAVSLTKNDYAEFELRPPINMVSGDHGTNILKFTVYDKGLPVDLSGNIAKITCKTPSGSRQQQDMTISSPQEGKMEVVLDQRFFTESGTYLAEVQLYDPANLKVRATLPRFTYDVDTSLLEEHRVVANEQFSILQQMVDTVASAEERSVEALDTATRAMNIATQKGDKATEEANRAKNEADRAKNEADRAWAADFAKHVTLDSEPQQNFNFIKNQVVKNGLANEEILNKPHCIFVKWDNIINENYLFKNLSNNGGWGIYYNATTKSFSIYYANGESQTKWINTNVPPTRNGWLYAIVKDNEIDITFNNGNFNLKGVSISSVTSKYVPQLPLPALGLEMYAYSNILTPYEIQHNVFTLDNSPSIKELHTTDSTGKTSILKLASDTDHVEDRSGRTQEQINRTFYKRMCEEIPSPSGEPITVNNGEEGYVLSAEIKGQTVKNYSLNYNSFVNKIISSSSTVTKPVSKGFDILPIELNKQYTVICKISKNTLPSGQGNENGVRIVRGETFGRDNVKFVDGGFTGIARHTFTTPSGAPSDFNTGKCNIFVHPNTSITTNPWEIVVDWWCCVEGDGSNISDNGVILDGINSTQAIISNNSQQYPIYEPTIQGKTRILNGKLVSLEPQGQQDVIKGLPVLSSVPFTKDIIDIANKTLKKTVDYYKITGEENWRATSGQVEGYFSAVMNLTDFTSTNSSSHVCLLCNKLEYFYWTDNSNLQREFIAHEIGGSGTDIVIIRLEHSKATDVESLKSYLKQQLSAGTPYEIMYKKKTPTTIQLTPEQLKAYDAHKKVISLGGVGGVYDTLEIKDDGSGVYTSEMMTVEVDKDSISLNSSAQNQILTKYFAISLEQEWLNENELLSNLFPTTPIWNNDVEGCFLLGGNKLVMGFRILKSKLISDDLDGVKDYLTKNKLTAIYRTKAPTVTHIDKSIMPTILTHKTNILEVGSAVRSSSFKVTVPVDQIATINSELEAIKAVLNSPSNLLLSAKYVEDEFNKNNKLESEMMN